MPHIEFELNGLPKRIFTLPDSELETWELVHKYANHRPTGTVWFKAAFWKEVANRDGIVKAALGPVGKSFLESHAIEMFNGRRVNFETFTFYSKLK